MGNEVYSPEQFIKLLLDDIIASEGRSYTNHAHDRGGCTKYGITLGTLKRWRISDSTTCEDVKLLTEAQARRIYRVMYLDPFMSVLSTSPRAFKFIVNAAVNHGVTAATKLLQRAINEVRPEASLVIDGYLGSKTREALNYVPADELILELIKVRLGLYSSILKDPSQHVFAAGWINRVIKDLS